MLRYKRSNEYLHNPLKDLVLLYISEEEKHREENELLLQVIFVVE